MQCDDITTDLLLDYQNEPKSLLPSLRDSLRQHLSTCTACTERLQRRQQEIQQQLHEAMQDLPQLHREVLLLRFHRSFSYEEIAAVIQMPIGTVKSRIHNGLKKLAKVMQRAKNQKKV